MLNTYQHCCSQIELVKELGYKYVNFQDICNVLFLDLSEDVNEPLEALVAGTYPQKVDLRISFKINRETSFFIGPALIK